MEVCTIVARNYLAPARVLARSLLEHQPDGRCWTLVIDDADHTVQPADEPFEVLRPADLQIEQWHQMVAGYDVLELSTAVKPWLLRHLLHERGLARVTYLDPDIRIYGSLREVDDLLAEHPLVVNPHLTAPMPRDGHRPAETDILTSGSFNLGFAGFAAGEETDRLLDWWAERLATDCVVDPERGLFVDQRWMDFAPGLVPTLHVLRDPGYNLAYWNLAGRRVTREAGGIEVDGRPLRFFHFSGYDPAHPERLSKHQDRIVLADSPVLRELCDGYGDELRAEPSSSPDYAFGDLPDGTPLDRVARRAYRRAVAQGELAPEDVFAAEGAERLVGHLSGPAPLGGGQGVTRYLAEMWSGRSDLREGFPDLEGPDGARLAAWARLPASGVPQRYLAPTEEVTTRQLGVNVVGYFSGVMGTGEHARQLRAALKTQGVTTSTTVLHPEAAPEDDTLGEGTGDESTSWYQYFNLLSVNADSVAGVAQQLGEAFFADRYTIGFWAWEVSSFPQHSLNAFAHVDEVWVGSRHVRDAIAPLSPVPVLAIPQPVSLAQDIASAPPPADLPDGFRFVFAFDYLSVFERKNPLAVVEAFRRAFPPGSGPSLVIKTLNSDRDPEAHGRLRAAVNSHPDVQLLERRLSARERDGLVNATDCYVSLHRAEGFGYTIAESMWAGRPVIATGYSGNVDYMTPENSYPVDYDLVEIGPDHDPYPSDGVWARPSVDHAAALMREVFADQEGARRRGERAAADIRATHGPEAAGRVMADRLSALLTTSGWRTGRHGAGASGHIYTDWVRNLIRSGPKGPGGAAGARSTARRTLLRLIKPLAIHEQLIDGELLKAIHTVDANTRDLLASHAAAARRLEDLEGQLQELRDQSGDARNGSS